MGTLIPALSGMDHRFRKVKNPFIEFVLADYTFSKEAGEVALNTLILNI